MKRDLRLYYYQMGSLCKIEKKWHKHSNLKSVEDCVPYLKNYRRQQKVLIEFFEFGQSKIIKIY